jgi:hypothetical protein
MLVIFSAMAMVLLASVAVTSESVSGVGKSKNEGDARQAVQDLASAVNLVYAQGLGAKARVFVRLPSGYDPSNSQVSGNSIRVRVSESDFVASTSAQVHGSLPQSQGGYWVWVASEGSSVRIGESFLFVLDSSIYSSMKANSTSAKLLAIANVGNSPLSVTLNPSWAASPSEINLSLSSLTFSINPSENTSVLVQFSASNSSGGIYSGSVTVNGDYDGGSESSVVPVTAEVIPLATQPNPTPSPTPVPQGANFTIAPHVWNSSIGSGYSSQFYLTLCSSNTSSFSNVSFVPSAGVPGVWISNTSSISLPSDSCYTKTLAAAVPNATSSQVYSGSVQVSGGGVFNDSVSVYFSVSNLDSYAPLLFDLRESPHPAFSFYNNSVFVAVSDNQTGNATITACKAKLDNGNWTSMVPQSGSWNQASQNASLWIGNLSEGMHAAFVNCTDANWNSVISNFSFPVYQSILFVQNSSAQTTQESNWKSWLTSNSWKRTYNFTVANASQVSSGALNLSYYKIVAMAEYVKPGAAFSLKLGEFNSQGGVLIFLGRALVNGSLVFSLSSTSSTSTGSSVNVTNSSHPITQGLSGSQNIYNGNRLFYYATSWNGLSLVGSPSGVNSPNNVVIGESNDAGKKLILGTETPLSFNALGTFISQRVLNYTLNVSTIAR